MTRSRLTSTALGMGLVASLLLATFSIGDEPKGDKDKSTINADDQPGKATPVPALNLELKRLSLENVDDKAGRWQFESGQVFQQGKHIASYATVLRVVNIGTDVQNTATLTTTIFFPGKKPPENMTLQGTHDYHSGDQTGSVSAASGQYAKYLGKVFSTSKSEKITIK